MNLGLGLNIDQGLSIPPICNIGVIFCCFGGRTWMDGDSWLSWLFHHPGLLCSTQKTPMFRKFSRKFGKFAPKPGAWCESISRSSSSALLPTCLGEGSSTKINYRKKGTLILTSLLEDLEIAGFLFQCGFLIIGTLQHKTSPDKAIFCLIWPNSARYWTTQICKT